MAIVNKFKQGSLVLATLGLTFFGVGGAALAQSNNNNGSSQFRAVLTPFNKSNVTGLATVSVGSDDVAHFHISANNLINAPHAQHIHFGPAAIHECPTLADDVNKDGIIDTTDGTPAYGPVTTSLTTKGDTSASSVLAVDRFPSYANRAEYDRTFQLTAVQAQQVRSGLSAVVLHGIDSIMPDGKYDGDLKSELDPSLPQEATAGAACGILHEVTGGIATTGSNNDNNGSNVSNSYGNNDHTKTVAYIALGLGAVALLMALGSYYRGKKSNV